MNEFKYDGGEITPHVFSFELPDFGALEPTNEQQNAHRLAQAEDLRQISQETLDQLDEEYGSGFPNYAQACNGEGRKYHNGYHGRQVGTIGKILCLEAGLDDHTANLTETGGHAHDRFQGPGHEAKSAEWVEEKMRSSGLHSEEDIDIVKSEINGTKTIIQDGKIVGQMATIQEYSSKKAETGSLAMASSDMAGLYLPQGPLLAQDLYEEISGNTEINNNLTNFYAGQIDLASSYKYPMPEAERLLTEHRGDIIEHYTELYDKLQHGDIEDWEQLRAYNLNFMLQRDSQHNGPNIVKY